MAIAGAGPVRSVADRISRGNGRPRISTEGPGAMQSKAFTKLFASITDSSIWSEDDATRIVWITMLAMSDSHGYVGASIPGLAARARKSVEEVERALERFRSPDTYSRTRDYDGRRITDADGGWVLLNYEKHRGMISSESVRESKRVWAAKARLQAASASGPDSESRTEISTVDTSRQSRILPSVSRSGSGSDLDPEGVQGEPTVEGVTVVDPKRARFAPADFEPNDAHKVRCQELNLRITDLLRDFKAFEFNREYSDWDRRFARWIEQAKLMAETDRAKAVSGAATGPRNSFARHPLNPLGWEPNAKHVAFARQHDLDLQRYARSYILSGGLEHRCIKDANTDFGRRLIRVTKGESFGLDLVAA